MGRWATCGIGLRERPVGSPAVSDVPAPPNPESAGPLPGAEQEIEVDLAAFLPEGVVLGDHDESGDVAIEVTEDVIATDEGVVVVDEAVIAADDGIVVIDDVVVATPEGAVVEEIVVEELVAGEPEAPAVDLEALSQIERDLDAVDAAIAALDAGTYGIDPATGQPIDDALLAEDPTRQA